MTGLVHLLLDVRDDLIYLNVRDRAVLTGSYHTSTYLFWVETLLVSILLDDSDAGGLTPLISGKPVFAAQAFTPAANTVVYFAGIDDLSLPVFTLGALHMEKVLDVVHALLYEPQYLA
jgi:hypothetical protein